MSIEEGRAKIDAIDDELLVLLNKRACVVREIMAEKRRTRLRMRDRLRETEILSRLSRSNPGPLDARAVNTMFTRIISESRRVGAESATVELA